MTNQEVRKKMKSRQQKLGDSTVPIAEAIE
jgi:hypothetical protein